MIFSYVALYFMTSLQSQGLPHVRWPGRTSPSSPLQATRDSHSNRLVSRGRCPRGIFPLRKIPMFHEVSRLSKKFMRIRIIYLIVNFMRFQDFVTTNQHCFRQFAGETHHLNPESD